MHAIERFHPTLGPLLIVSQTGYLMSLTTSQPIVNAGEVICSNGMTGDVTTIDVLQVVHTPDA